MKLLKWFFGAALTFLILLAGVGVFLGPQIRDMIERQQGQNTGPEVRVEPAERGRIVRTVSAPGDIEPRSMVQISARTSAQIVELPYDEGDTVSAGEVVVRLDDKDLLASLDAARARLRGEQARLEGARAGYINANLEWERVSQLFETADVPKAEVDQAEAALRSAEAERNAAEHAVAGARADVQRAEEALKYTTIRSPIDGRVTVLNAEVGEIVVTGTMNNAGTVIMEIADLSEMLVRAQVDEIDIAKVEVGQPALVYVNAYPEKPFEGEVRRIALQSQRDTSGAKFYDTEVAVFMGDRALYAGLSATVDIEVETAEGVILVPTQAVMDKRTEDLENELLASPHVRRDKTFTPVVFVLEDGKAMMRPVETGFSDLTQTSISGGLEPGEEVIAGPWSQLQQLEHEKAVQREQTLAESGEGEGDSAPDEPENAAEEDETVTS
jgi:HlyD family secretion protein